jgi:hypothetical protein
MRVWEKVKEAMSPFLDEDLVAEVSARYDAFSIFKAGKKCNTTFSTNDLYLTMKISSHYRDTPKIEWKRHLC